jgi:hypothetical protein
VLIGNKGELKHNLKHKGAIRVRGQWGANSQNIGETSKKGPLGDPWRWR